MDDGYKPTISFKYTCIRDFFISTIKDTLTCKSSMLQNTTKFCLFRFPSKAVLSSLLIIYVINFINLTLLSCYNKWQNTTRVTGGAGTIYRSGSLEFSPVYCGVPVVRSLVYSVKFCRSLPPFPFDHCIVCTPLIYGF